PARRHPMRCVAIALLMTFVTLDAARAAKGAGPVKLTPAAADSIRAAYAKARTDAERDLKESPTSYLAAVARTDFGEKPALVLGRGADCDLRVDDPELSAHHLRVSAAGDSFRAEATDDTAHCAVRAEWPRSAT